MTQYSAQEINSMFLIVMLILAVLSFDRGLPGGLFKDRGAVVLGWICLAIGVFIPLCSKLGW